MLISDWTPVVSPRQPSVRSKGGIQEGSSIATMGENEQNIQTIPHSVR